MFRLVTILCAVELLSLMWKSVVKSPRPCLVRLIPTGYFDSDIAYESCVTCEYSVVWGAAGIPKVDISAKGHTRVTLSGVRKQILNRLPVPLLVHYLRLRLGHEQLKSGYCHGINVESPRKSWMPRCLV